MATFYDVNANLRPVNALQSLAEGMQVGQQMQAMRREQNDRNAFARLMGGDFSALSALQDPELIMKGREMVRAEEERRATAGMDLNQLGEHYAKNQNFNALNSLSGWRKANAPEQPKAPPTWSIPKGDVEVTYGYDAGGNQVELGRKPLWKPQPTIINGDGGKPPSGYRWTADGNLEPIPGGPAANKPSGKSLPVTAINDLSDKASTASAFASLSSGFQDDFGGDMLESWGNVKNLAGRTFGDDTGRAQWWQGYQEQKNLLRNKLFGASLTSGEKAEFDKAQIHPGMSPAEIRKNLERQSSAAQRAAQKLAAAYAKGGYSAEQIEELTGYSLSEAQPSLDGKQGGAQGAQGWKQAGYKNILEAHADYKRARDQAYKAGNYDLVRRLDAEAKADGVIR